ncbi:unnamed protein product [Brassicogethes aeneus]|uniref:RING finger protein 141 n=1 Tax=Brassicogethes aeneus TaxID=1431903 RepID=A0A9P0BEE1_BRAAE|nr:unnamed protein product [Brassicogethes aeneus]
MLFFVCFRLKNSLDSNGKKLVFAIKKNTDSTIFWKATVQIACVKFDPDSKKIESYKLFNLLDFLKIYSTIKSQNSAAEQSALNVSKILSSLESTSIEGNTECCICFERKQDVTLPCAHSYCTKCIEEWSESHDTCPICRDKFESSEDTWVISEAPNADEISKEIQENLTKLTEEHSDDCYVA